MLFVDVGVYATAVCISACDKGKRKPIWLFFFVFFFSIDVYTQNTV